MDQLAPVINCYADHIHILQGIFVGNYGEMNNSIYLSTQSMTALLTRLADLTDPSIYLSVRTPAQWRSITSSVSLPFPFPTFDGSLMSRLGLFNDGMLGSDTDLGTYGTISRDGSETPGDKGTQQEELAFQDMLCRYVPNGGEAVIDNTTYPGDDCFDGCTGYKYIRAHLGYRYVLQSSDFRFNTWLGGGGLTGRVLLPVRCLRQQA